MGVPIYPDLFWIIVPKQQLSKNQKPKLKSCFTFLFDYLIDGCELLKKCPHISAISEYQQ